MINQLLARLYRPERGWDPVPASWAGRYADHEWTTFDPAVVDWLETQTGSLAGKRLLDLGGGPGQYTAEFARRGAHVTWHDVSRRYREIAQARAQDLEASIEFSLGYLEDAKKFTDAPFDVVFNRICWNYSQDDRQFAELVYALVRPGGAGYVDSHHGVHRGRLHEVLYEVNRRTGWKIGHPPPPPGRIAALLSRHPLVRLDTSRSTVDNDRVLFVKPAPEEHGE